MFEDRGNDSHQFTVVYDAATNCWYHSLHDHEPTSDVVALVERALQSLEHILKAPHHRDITGEMMRFARTHTSAEQRQVG